MVQNSKPSIQIDLNEFKLRLHLKSQTQLTLHFDSPSRKFYLSVIALVVNEMKRSGKIKSILLQEHLDVLVLLNESIGEAVGSSDRENLLHRIYRKWKDALPNLEEAPLFKVLGKKKGEGEGAVGKVYSFTDEEKDEWANLFGYMGSEENVRLKFAIDRIGVGLNETSIIFWDSLNGDAWDQFISSLKNGRHEESESAEETTVSEPLAVPFSSPQKRKISRHSWYRWVIPVVVIGILAGTIWKIYFKPAPAQVASIDRMKHPLPDMPSIAVLPFVNLSEDPKQELLCDGMTRDIINALSKVPMLFVIAPNSMFTYKGKPVNVRRVSEDLGVRYVLEGSVQRSANRIRITTQLADALTGNHLWGERYERDLNDLFALQNEITFRIVTVMRVKLTEGEQMLGARSNLAKYSRSKQGFDWYLKVMESTKYLLGFNIEDMRAARRLAEEAIAIWPDTPGGYVQMGWIHSFEYILGLGKSEESIEKGIEMAQKALAVSDSIPGAHAILCSLYTLKGEYDKAIAEGERAIAVEPGGAQAYAYYANSLSWAGRLEEAIPMFQKARRLNPLGTTVLYLNFGIALTRTGRFEEAVSAYQKSIERAPDNIVAHVFLASAYSSMGREKEARAEAAEVLRIDPKFSVDGFSRPIAYMTRPERDKFVNALHKAGLN
jgi:adenylate cyclase